MNDESLIEYPCRFPIKIMGKATADLKMAIDTIVSAHVPDGDLIELTVRDSGKENYHAYTVIITATSREQLDDIYIALTDCEHVIMAL